VPRDRTTAVGRSVERRWGLLDAVGGIAAAFIGSALVATLVGAPKNPSLVQQFVENIPLWLALGIVPIWATRTKGRGPEEDLGLAIAPVDVLLGGLTGAALQFLLVPAVYFPLRDVISRHDVEKQSQDLADKTHGAGWLLLIVMVVVIAPVVEELFYRGLVMRALERDLKERHVRWASGLAVVITAVVFAAMHFEPAAMLGLAVFAAVVGGLVMWTGRLGTSMCAHVAFNACALLQIHYHVFRWG
jgi:membrane protease YdiL (CAAX protease family)